MLLLAALAAATLTTLDAKADFDLEAEGAERIGQEIPEFKLRDYRGKEVSLSDFEDRDVLVVAFLGTDCPLVKIYASRLQELSEKYADKGVTVIGINSNRQDTPTKIGAYAKQYGMKFPVLKDPENKVADQFQAIRTPEVFVLDKQRVVRYWGRIDDQYGFDTGVGYGRPKATRFDTIEAIKELLSGKDVSVAVTQAPGCHIGRVPEVEPHGDVTYSNQIARILNKRCVECHRKGQIAPFPLTNYGEVDGWGEMINEVVQQRRMPPWYADPKHGEFANDASMTEAEKELIATWVENGAPQGDPKMLPEPPNYAQGWTIPKPDLILNMTDEPYTVQAEGVVDYQYFTVDPGFKEDKWVKAVQARPGNLAVVHHIICFIETPSKNQFAGRRDGGLRGEAGDDDEEDEDGAGGGGGSFRRNGALIGYAPGMQSRAYPPGCAIKIPAGSKFVFQMHYTPVGEEQTDMSTIGMIFADPAEVTHEVRGAVCGKLSIAIPPYESDHIIKSKHRLRHDVEMMSMMPHMHVRGVAFRFEVDYPDGTSEVLLDVPEYDFNWQLWYDLAKPKILPKGSTIRCTARYDNSEENIFNPDPSETVRFGDQTWEEMMFGFYTTLVPVSSDKAKKKPSGKDLTQQGKLSVK
jgi:peroxiredoxin